VKLCICNYVKLCVCVWNPESYMCLRVSMGIRKPVSLCAHPHKHTHTHMYMNAHIHIHVNTRTRTRTCTRTRTTGTRKHTSTRTHTQNKHAHAHAHVHAIAHTHTRAHAHAGPVCQWGQGGVYLFRCFHVSPPVQQQLHHREMTIVGSLQKGSQAMLCVSVES
jgi:hypothetical protein